MEVVPDEDFYLEPGGTQRASEFITKPALKVGFVIIHREPSVRASALVTYSMDLNRWGRLPSP